MKKLKHNVLAFSFNRVQLVDLPGSIPGTAFLVTSLSYDRLKLI